MKNPETKPTQAPIIDTTTRPTRKAVARKAEGLGLSNLVTPNKNKALNRKQPTKAPVEHKTTCGARKRYFLKNNRANASTKQNNQSGRIKNHWQKAILSYWPGAWVLERTCPVRRLSRSWPRSPQINADVHCSSCILPE